MTVLSCKVTRRVFHKGCLLSAMFPANWILFKKDDKDPKSSVGQLLPDQPPLLPLRPTCGTPRAG